MAVRKTKAGLALKRWFKEDWKDQRTGKKCGRQKGEKRGTPYCRPTKRISKKTPKTASEMTATEKRSRIAQKKRLGQPAGAPRRVKSLKRRKIMGKLNPGLKAFLDKKKKNKKPVKKMGGGANMMKKPVKAKMGKMMNGKKK